MKVLVYVECSDLSDLDTYLGQGVDDGPIESYAALTVDGAPLVYESGTVSNPEELTGLALQCAGITG